MNRSSSSRPVKEQAISSTGDFKPLKALYLDQDFIDKAISTR